MQLHGRALTSHVWGLRFNPQHIKTMKKSTERSTLPSIEPCAIRTVPPVETESNISGRHLDTLDLTPSICPKPWAANMTHWSGAVIKSRNPGSNPPPQRWMLAAGLHRESWLPQFPKHLYLQRVSNPVRFTFCVYRVMWRLFLLNFLVVTNDTDFERQSEFTCWDKPHLFITYRHERGWLVRILLSPSAPTGDAGLCHLECPSPVLLLMFYWP